MKVCSNCGSENIQQLWSVYIPANEPASLDDIEGNAYFEMEDHAWCPDCEGNEMGCVFVKEKEE